MKISMGQSAGQSIITIIKKSKNCASLVWLLKSANKKSKNKILSPSPARFTPMNWRKMNALIDPSAFSTMLPLPVPPSCR